MVSWLHDFSNTYHSKTKRYPGACAELEAYLSIHLYSPFPVFYMSASWWGECTGGSKAFGKQNPLWIADWASKVGSIPAGWEFYYVLAVQQSLFDCSGRRRRVQRLAYQPQEVRKGVVIVLPMQVKASNSQHCFFSQIPFLTFLL